jgi:hypothetical protein
MMIAVLRELYGNNDKNVGSRGLWTESSDHRDEEDWERTRSWKLLLLTKCDRPHDMRSAAGR